MSTASPNDLLSQVLALPEGDRLRIAAELLASVDATSGLSEEDDDFEDIIAQRSQEMRDGTVTPIDADESIERIQRSLQERRRQ